MTLRLSYSKIPSHTPSAQRHTLQLCSTAHHWENGLTLPDRCSIPWGHKPVGLKLLGTGCLAKSDLRAARKAKVLSCECLPDPAKLRLQP